MPPRTKTITPRVGEPRVRTVRATALDGSTLELPAALGDGALLLLGFSAAHKDDAKAWAEAVIGALGPDVPWLALAVLPKKLRLGSKVLLAGVRRALTDPEWRSRVGVLFDDAGALARGLGAVGTEEVCVLWADADGVVAWRASGPPTDAALAGLRAAAEA